MPIGVVRPIFIMLPINFKKVGFMAIALLILYTFCSCSHRLTDFTVISTKNVPIGKGYTSIKKAEQKVQGVDKKHMVLFIPFGYPNMKEAIDKAIESYDGAIGLVDGVVKSRYWTCLFYGQNSYIVEGTPIYESTEVISGLENKNNQASQNSRITPYNNVQPDNQFSMVFYHEVKKDETIFTIANLYDIPATDIIKWNKLSTQYIHEGMKLIIMVK